MASKFFGRQRECRFYTAGCGNKMAVSVTGPRAVNEFGGPVIPGSNLAPVGETGYSHRLTAYKIVGHFFGLSYRKILGDNQVKNSVF